MTKSPDAFRTISEVADWLGVQTHVLRFWESKFSQVKPVKRAGGRRYYRPTDMMLLGGIKTLLHDDGMTIKGVQKLLREEGVSHVSSFSQSLDVNAQSEESEEAASETVTRFEARAEDRDSAEAGEAVVPEVAPARQEPAEPAEAAEPAEPDEEMPELDLPQPVAAAAPPAGPAAEPDAAVTADTETPPEPAAPSPLPSFLTQPMGGTAEPEPLRPNIVDAPDPPPEDQIDVAAGALARLGRVQSLDAAQIRALAPLLGRLAVLRDKLAGASV